MLKYQILFQLALIFYCATSFAFVRSPLSAIAYFMGFRSVFSVTGFIGIKAFGVIQYFVPGLLLLLIPTYISLARKQFKFHLYSPVVFYLAFCALIIFEAPIFFMQGTSAGLIIQEILKILFPFLAYVLFYTGIVEKQDLIKAVRNILLVSSIPILIGFLSFLTQVGYDPEMDAFLPLKTLIAPASTIASRNLFGIFLALCLCFAIAYYLETKSKKAIFALFMVLAMLMISQNRGTWIAIFFAIAASVFLFRRYLSPGKWLIGAIAVGILASPLIISRFAQLNSYDQWGQSQDTAEDRLETSKAVLNLALESPVFGGGPYSFQKILQGGAGLPHNDYLRIASEYGFSATFIFIIFLLSQLFWVMKHRHVELWPYQFAACIGQMYVIIISLAQNLITDTTSYMLIFALMAMAHRAFELSTPIQEKSPYKFLIGNRENCLARL